MKRFITRLNGLCNQELKKKQEEVSNAAYQSGWMDMALYVYDNSAETEESLSSRFSGIIAGISEGDIVVVQLPTGNGHSWEQKLITHIKAYGGTVIVYIHALSYSAYNVNDSVEDTVFTCWYQSAVITDSFLIRDQLCKKGIPKKSIFICEEANDVFDKAYYISKCVNLASEYAVLGEISKYQLIQKDIEREATKPEFSYYVARESFDGKHAITFRFKGDADLIILKSGNEIIWQSEYLKAHYAIVSQAESYTLQAVVYTPSGKYVVAETENFGVSDISFNKDKPKVSLIIPMYNSASFISRTIDTVLGQSQEDLEIVLVDDESTDNTLEIVKWYEKRYENIKLIKKKNGGQASARNTGINAAQGEYITFMDHDDTLPPDSQKVLYELISKTNADIGIGNVINMISETFGHVVEYTDKSIEIIDAETYMNFHSPVMIWHKIYRKDLCKNNLFIPRYHEDISWSPIVFSYANSIVLTSEIVYEWDRTRFTQSSSILKQSEDWFTKTYCEAVEDALNRCNQNRIDFVKKMLLSCEAFNYHPNLYEAVEKIVQQY